MHGMVAGEDQSTDPGARHHSDSGLSIDTGITHSPRKPKTSLLYEVVADREDRNDKEAAKAAMRVIEVVQPGVDAEARWFGAKVPRYRGKVKAHMLGIFYKSWHTA